MRVQAWPCLRHLLWLHPCGTRQGKRLSSWDRRGGQGVGGQLGFWEVALRTHTCRGGGETGQGRRSQPVTAKAWLMLN